MDWICTETPPAIDGGRRERQIVTDGRQQFSIAVRRRQMAVIRSALQEMAGFATSSSLADQALPGFEELAMPLFDSLYNFALWMVRNSNDAEDLVQETYLKALRGFATFQPAKIGRAHV